MAAEFPPGPDTVNLTVNEPATVSSWEGFSSVLEAPSPKSHCQEVTAPWEASLNWTVTGALPLKTSREKDATAGGMGVGVAVGVGVDVGVGAGAVHATSSNTDNATRKGQCKTLRRSPIIARLALAVNEHNHATVIAEFDYRPGRANETSCGTHGQSKCSSHQATIRTRCPTLPVPTCRDGPPPIGAKTDSPAPSPSGDAWGVPWEMLVLEHSIPWSIYHLSGEGYNPNA